ncbi:excalibur calcium-binding domain-containing protein [Nocardia sp. NPDC050406]
MPTVEKPASVYYKNCAAARAAGAAPLHRGEPGYRSELDADGDGTACDKK